MGGTFYAEEGMKLLDWWRTEYNNYSELHEGFHLYQNAACIFARNDTTEIEYIMYVDPNATESIKLSDIVIEDGAVYYFRLYE